MKENQFYQSNTSIELEFKNLRNSKPNIKGIEKTFTKLIRSKSTVYKLINLSPCRRSIK